MLCVLAAPIPMQHYANAPGKAPEVDPRVLSPAAHVKNSYKIPGSCLQSGPGLPITASWEANHQIEDFSLCLSISFSNSNFHITVFLKKKRRGGSIIWCIKSNYCVYGRKMKKSPGCWMFTQGLSHQEDTKTRCDKYINNNTFIPTQ